MLTLNKTWRLSELRQLRGFAIEWLSPSGVLLSKRNRLYRAASLDETPERVSAFPAPAWRQLAATPRLGQRLLRFMYSNALPLDDGSIFVTFDRGIGVIADGVCRLLDGLQRPCRVLRSGCAIDQDGSVFFGEYVRPRSQGPIRLYRYVPGASTLEVAYEFPAGDIRHVHGIHVDPFTQEMWLVSGDLPKQCRVLRTHDQFRSIDVVGEGDESWRCLSPIFTEQSVYYGTDSEFQQNYIYRLHRRSGQRDVIAEIDGPVYYSRRVGDDIFFATAAHRCPSQQDRSAVIWHVRDDGAAQPVVVFKKDIFQTRAFLSGLIHFPDGPGLTDNLYFNGIALAGADNRTFVLQAVV